MQALQQFLRRASEHW